MKINLIGKGYWAFILPAPFLPLILNSVGNQKRTDIPSPQDPSGRMHHFPKPIIWRTLAVLCCGWQESFYYTCRGMKHWDILTGWGTIPAGCSRIQDTRCNLIVPKKTTEKGRGKLSSILTFYFFTGLNKERRKPLPQNTTELKALQVQRLLNTESSRIIFLIQLNYSMVLCCFFLSNHLGK